MTVRYKKDDYLIVSVPSGESYKNKLGLVVMEGKLMLEEGVENDDTTETIQFDKEDVVVNLGPKPANSLLGKKIAGAKIELYVESMSLKGWPIIHLYREWEGERESKYFNQVLKKMRKQLDELQMTEFIERMTCIRVKHKNGKYAGMYVHRPKKDDTAADEIILTPEDFLDRNYLHYVMAHECGHGVWAHHMSEDIRARWIRLYSKRVIVDHFDEESMERLKKDLVNYEGDLTDYMKEIADIDDKVLIKECMAWIKRVHKIDQRGFLSLCSLGRDKAYEDLWPAYADLGTPEFDVSEYAGKSPEELFAESFAFFITKKDLPKDITKAMEKTLKAGNRY